MFPNQTFDENSPIHSTNGETFIESLLCAKHCVKLWGYSDLHIMYHSLSLHVRMALSLELYVLFKPPCSSTLEQYNIMTSIM